MYKEIIDKIKPEIEKTISFFENEMRKIRTGTASPSIVEDIMVDCFGQNLPLKQLGAISLSGSRQIIIQPWDKSYLESIEKAINRSDIGINPIVDKNIIRLNMPSLTGELRESLLRVLSEKQEESRKTIRKWREEAWREIQEKCKDGEIREDDKFKAKNDLQKLVDEYNEKTKEIGDRKKKELE
ncbi:MAG: ribosome recycling factor [Patescibacteria group bacterium]|nr:ribosome recycling factor [Patescibacteria group bacterium]